MLVNGRGKTRFHCFHTFIADQLPQIRVAATAFSVRLSGSMHKRFRPSAIHKRIKADLLIVDGFGMACPNSKDVTVYQDACIVGFSDQRFLDFPGVNSPYAVSSWDSDNLTVPAAWFDAAVAALMNATVDRAVSVTAASNNSSARQYFATGVEDFDAEQYPKIYGLAQCVPDMTAVQCRGCLGSLVASMPGFLDGKPAGRSLGVWCNLRYSVSPFYTGPAMLHLPAPAPAPAPAPTAVPSVVTPKTGAGRRRAAGIAAGVACFVVLVVIFSAVALVRFRRKIAKKNGRSRSLEKIGRAKCTVFDFFTLQEATENFSEDLKIGEGGFGIVYKGKLPDGQEVAVKKLLDSATGHGLLQLHNELQVLATLQHRNLVRLHGFCVHQNEKMLVYEYIKNGSLDNFLFDTETGNKLTWDQWDNIIVGIAKGIMYLHEDSRIRIIHRDLKANNILLDENADPKISDFGLARLQGDHTQTKTATVAGTYGYMAPEYAMRGHYSIKSDVFSFGILILEILTGRRSSGSFNIEESVDLLSLVWEHWTMGTIVEVMDPSLRGKAPAQQMLKYVHIGLLCVQDNPVDRPMMSTVNVMLSGSTFSLQAPLKPVFFIPKSGYYSTVYSESYPTTSQSTANVTSGVISPNEVSITELEPR
ncbi:unnamed protein product [Miscanthus lutarioriparius]|uniref:Uncharacterized protein n=1 Tax=Miscanthus lutarioriparius TaxID=422564 RepID=A0A811N7W1_9POAL|nr:unnamed protein product [Miscanthus lutarioriparius]